MALAGFILFALFVMLGLAALFWRGPEIHSPLLFLFRGLFPSWQFFDRAGLRPRLFVRGQTRDGEWTPYFMFIPRGIFRFRDLFFNPYNNLALAEQTLVENLSLDIQRVDDGRDVEKLSSYSMVRHLALAHLEEQTGHRHYKAYHFELRMMPPFDHHQSGEVMLSSPVISCLSDAD